MARKIAAAKLRDTMLQMTRGKLSLGAFQRGLQGVVKTGKGLGRDFHKDVLQKIMRGKGDIEVTHGRQVIGEYKQSLRSGGVSFDGKAGQLSAKGRDVGAHTVEKLAATPAGTSLADRQREARERAQVVKMQNLRVQRFQREREAEQSAPVPATPGTGNPAAPLTPLTSVSRLPQAEEQKKVSIGELQTEANPPQTSAGQPEGSVPLTGSNAGTAAPTGAERDIQAPPVAPEASATPGEHPVGKDDDDVRLPDPGKAEDMEI